MTTSKCRNCGDRIECVGSAWSDKLGSVVRQSGRYAIRGWLHVDAGVRCTEGTPGTYPIAWPEEGD